MEYVCISPRIVIMRIVIPQTEEDLAEEAAAAKQLEEEKAAAEIIHPW